MDVVEVVVVVDVVVLEVVVVGSVVVEVVVEVEVVVVEVVESTRTSKATTPIVTMLSTAKSMRMVGTYTNAALTGSVVAPSCLSKRLSPHLPVFNTLRLILRKKALLRYIYVFTYLKQKNFIVDATNNNSMEEKTPFLQSKYGTITAVLLAIAVVAAVAFFILGSWNSPDAEPHPEEEKSVYDMQAEPALFDALLEEEGVTLTSDPENYCITCNITYSDPGPMEVTLTSEELTSYLQATNNENGVFKNIRIKLGDDNELEAAADIDLTGFGHSFSGPVYAVGSIERAGPNSVRIEVERASSGPLPIPGEYVEEGEEELENLINNHLIQMPGLRINKLEVVDGELVFEGYFPKTISAS